MNFECMWRLWRRFWRFKSELFEIISIENEDKTSFIAFYLVNVLRRCYCSRHLTSKSRLCINFHFFCQDANKAVQDLTNFLAITTKI